MYVCMYVCMYVYIYIYTSVYIVTCSDVSDSACADSSPATARSSSRSVDSPIAIALLASPT